MDDDDEDADAEFPKGIQVQVIVSYLFKGILQLLSFCKMQMDNNFTIYFLDLLYVTH